MRRRGLLTGDFAEVALVVWAPSRGRRSLHTAEVTGSIPVAPTPIAQFRVWDWSSSPRREWQSWNPSLSRSLPVARARGTGIPQDLH